MNSVMIKRVLQFIIVVFIGLIGWQIYQAFTLSSSSEPSTISGPVIRNAYYPKLSQDGKLQYYNGDAFVSYNFADKTKTQLGPIRGITNVIKADWVNDGVVFSVSEIPAWHPLWSLYDNYIAQHDGDSDPVTLEGDKNIVNYHWYLSFKKNTLSLLSVGVDNALLYATVTENGGLFYRDTPAYSMLKSDGTTAKNVSPLASEDNERRVIKASETAYTYLAAKGDGIALYTHDIASNKSTELLASVYKSKGRSIYDQVAMVGNTLYYLEPVGEESESSIHTRNIETGETKQIVDRFQGVIRQVSPTEVSAVHIGNEYTKLYILSDMNRTVTMKNSYIRPISVHISKDATYVSSSKGYLYKIGGEEAQKQENLALETKINGGDDFALTRNIESDNDNSYTATFISGSVSERMDQLYKAVAEAGYNPLDFSFNANPGARVSY